MVSKNNPLRDSRHLDKYCPFVNFFRRPLSTDIRHPKTGQIYSRPYYWRVSLKPDGTGPVTGVEGELWYLQDITANVANWKQLVFTSGGAPIVSVTGDAGGAVPGDGVGDIDFNGLVVANATRAKPIFFTGTPGSFKQELEIQVAVALAVADITKAGLSTYDNTDFSVDPATGHVTLAGAGAGQTITGDSGGALSPTAGNWNILGGTGMDTAGAGSTLTLNADISGSGTYADNAIIRGDGGASGVQDSGVLINDLDEVSGVTRLDVDNIRVDGNTISSTDPAGNIIIQPNTTGLVLIPNTLVINDITGESTITIGGVTLDSAVMVHSEGAVNLAEVTFERHSDTAGFGAHLILGRSRGSEAVEAVVQDGDVLGQVVFVGHDGTDFELAANIRIEVDGTPGAGDMPGRILLMTSTDGAATPIEGLRLDESQIITLANPLPVGSGGTGLTTITDGGLMLGSGTGAVTPLGQATNGMLPIGSTGADPVLATITAGTGVSVTNGAGSITIDSTGGGFTWNGVAGTTQAMVANNGYIFESGSASTSTLPGSCTLGDTFWVVAKGAGLVAIAQNASQTIQFGNMVTTSGVGGSLAATAIGDTCELLCTADDEFYVLTSVGNWTVT